MPTKQIPEKQLTEKLPYKEIHKEKEVAKEHKDNKDNPDKLKHEKEAKDQVKEKPEKEKNEKLEKHEKTEKHEKVEKREVKENLKNETLETLPSEVFDPGPEAIAGVATAQATTLKLTDKQVFTEKLFKVEFEKTHKHEKIEALEKYHKNEKIEYEYYTPVTPVIPDPGPVEQRLTALEAALAQLTHFIPQEQRPDLSKGALKQEPAAAAPAKPEEEKKK